MTETTEPEIIAMYTTGPLRQFSLAPFLGCVPYHSGKLHGYAGRYCCAKCKQLVVRVLYYGDRWICLACVEIIRAKRRVRKGAEVPPKH